MGTREIIDRLATAEDDDIAFLAAATINLYNEALRRRCGRTLFASSDARTCLGMIATLLAIETKPSYVPARKVRPTEGETEAVATSKAIEELQKIAEGA